MLSHESLLQKPEAPYATLLREAGFDISYREDLTFTQGRDQDKRVDKGRGATNTIKIGPAEGDRRYLRKACEPVQPVPMRACARRCRPDNWGKLRANSKPYGAFPPIPLPTIRSRNDPRSELRYPRLHEIAPPTSVRSILSPGTAGMAQSDKDRLANPLGIRNRNFASTHR